jgi:preprotein translocase subunit SecD
MKIIGPLACALAMAASAAVAAEAPPRTLEMRLVIDCTPGSTPLPFDNQGIADRLCLSGDLILDRADIVNAREVHTPYGTDAIRITIDPKAVSRLTAATTDHIGRRIAVVYNGKIVSAPIVQEPITGRELEISMGSGIDDLSEIAAALRSGP